jgi:hypothetical protein
MADLEETINRTPVDLVIVATPMTWRSSRHRQAQPACATDSGDQPALTDLLGAQFKKSNHRLHQIPAD